MNIAKLMLEQLDHVVAARLPQQSGVPFPTVAREYLHIRTKDDRVIRFHLKAIQKRYLAMKRLAVRKGARPRFLLLKYRRGGFTTLEQGVSYYMASRRRNVTVATLAHDGDTTRRIFRIAQLMHERDPKAPPIKGPGNSTRLEFPGLNSFFYLLNASSRGAGRGDTLSRVHWSEVAFSCEGWNQIEGQRKVLTALNEAASHGEMVLETTPNGSELFRELYMDARRGANDWTAIFIPWFEDSSNVAPFGCEDESMAFLESLDDEEAESQARLGLSLEQLKWRRQKKRELKHLFVQEYPEDDESCWLISGVPFFDNQKVMALRDTLPTGTDYDQTLGLIPPGARRIPDGYEEIYEPPEVGVNYVMGVDTSEGLPGCDFNGVGVMRKDDGRQVASLHGLFRPPELAAHAVRLSKIYNDALIGVEREAYGHAVIQKVMDLGVSETHHRGGSLYFMGEDVEDSRDDKRKHRAGWSTNAVTRPVMLDSLREWLDAPLAGERVHDRRFLEECLTFRMQDKGRFDHDSGCHDDSLFKWAIANQMRQAPWSRVQFEEVPISRYTA